MGSLPPTRFLGFPVVAMWYSRGSVPGLQPEHLNEIADYVSSTFRERKAKQYTTMAEKLPPFITSAKNRKIDQEGGGKTFKK